MPFTDPNGPRRVLLVGWDGACWSVLDRLLDGGRLPELARLIGQGFRSGLQSTVPPVTPPAWSAMATGLGPGRSGILGFRHFDFSQPSGFSPRMVSSADIAGRTLFEHLAGQGESLSLVGWPMTWPVWPIGGSVLVAGWPRPPTSKVPVWPTSWAKRLGPWGEEAPDRPVGEPSLEHQIAEASWWDRRHAEIGCKLLRERDDGLVAVVFSGTDHLSHSLWGDPRLDEHFERVDAHLGVLRRAAGPDCTTLLVSDHGFGPAPARLFHLGRWLGQQGLLKIHDQEGPRRLGKAVAALRHGLPSATWKRLRDRLPEALRAWGHSQASAASSIDLSESKAFRVGLYTSWEGVVCPGLSTDARERLVADLLALDPVRLVHFSDELFPGAPLGSVPDLVVELHENFAGGELLGEGPLITEVPGAELQRWPATHRRQGILVAAGPGVRRSRAPNDARVEDVGLNALALAGAELPDDRDGRVWAEALSVKAKYCAFSSPPVASLGRTSEEAAHREDMQEDLRRLGYL